MAHPGLILPYLSRMFNTPVPNYVLGADLPQGILAMYDSRTMTIYFRDVDPPIYVIAHEFGHHLHSVYGIDGDVRELEALANKIEKGLSEFYGVSPKVYSMLPPYRDEFGKVIALSGILLILFAGLMG